MGNIIQYILDLGAAVFLPLIMIIIGLAVKMKPKKAIICGLTLGIAFTAINVVLTFMFDTISPAASAFVTNTGINLKTVDVGWSPVASVSWAWPYALMVFPIQIGINLLMLAFGKCGLKEILQTGVGTAAALVLFPIAANFFIDALGPIAEAAGNFMKSKYKGRDFYVGVDWSVLGGRTELWVVSILLVPVELLFAILLAKVGVNSVLPLAAIINVAATVPALIVTKGNILRMFVMGVVTTPIYLMVSSQFAPMITKLAIAQNTLDVPAGQLLTYYGAEGPEFRWALIQAFSGDNKFLAILPFVAFAALFFWYKSYMKKKDAEMACEHQRLGLK